MLCVCVWYMTFRHFTAFNLYIVHSMERPHISVHCHIINNTTKLHISFSLSVETYTKGCHRQAEKIHTYFMRARITSHRTTKKDIFGIHNLCASLLNSKHFIALWRAKSTDTVQQGKNGTRRY